MDENFSKNIKNSLLNIYTDISENDSANVSDEGANPLFEQICSVNERYQNPELIATGGMKRVYKAFDFKTNRHIALAQLHEGSPEVLYDAFIREARLTALLEHPNIINIHDIGEIDNTPYFTMDLKVGDTLADILRRLKESQSYSEKYDLNALLSIFIKVCDAVSYAHSKKVVHLDLKPENIQIGDYGEVLVCDWGIGKILGKADEEIDDLLLNPDLLNNMTMHGKIKGTPGFMAPEQVLGKEKTNKNDIYSLGAILYCILTGSPPINDELETMLRKTISGDFVEPVKKNPKTPTSLNAIVMKAMENSPEDRYPSVESLREDVYKYLSGFSPAAENAGPIKELKLFYSRNKAICVLVLLFMILIVSTSSFFIQRLSESRNEVVKNFNDLKKSNEERDAAMTDLSEKSEELSQSLSKLKKSNEIRDLALNTSLPAVLEESQNDWEQGYYKRGYERIMTVYKNDIKNQHYWFLKGCYEFGQLEFEKSADSLTRAIETGKRTSDVTKAFFQIIEEYKGKKLTISDIFTIKGLVHGGMRTEVAAMMFETVNRNFNLKTEAKMKFFERALISISKQKQIQLTHKIKTNGSFIIDLNGNKDLTRISPIRGLNVEELNLSNCERFQHLNDIFTLKNLKKLDLSNTEISKYDFNWYFSFLDDLIIKGNYIHILRIKSRNLKFVDLSHSELAPVDISIAHAKILKINDCKISNYGFLTRIKGLEKLYLQKGQKIGKGALKSLKKNGVELIYE